MKTEKTIWVTVIEPERKEIKLNILVTKPERKEVKLNVTVFKDAGDVGELLVLTGDKDE